MHDLLEERSAYSLRNTPAYLTVDDHRVDHAPAVFTNNIAVDGRLAGPGIDLTGSDVSPDR